MARYIQKIALNGNERWIGWDVDGVGSEIPGLLPADQITEDELLAHGIREFRPMPFESFLGMNACPSTDTSLLDEDLVFRLDALMVNLDRLRMSGSSQVPRVLLSNLLGGSLLEDPRVRARIVEWERAGAVEWIGADDCYLRIKGRFA
jgi:hypothetical protein